MSRVVYFTISQCDDSCPYYLERGWEERCGLSDRLFYIGESKPFPDWCPLPESKEESK